MKYIVQDTIAPDPDREKLSPELREKLDAKTKAARYKERWIDRLQRALGPDIDDHMQEFAEAVRVRRERHK